MWKLLHTSLPVQTSRWCFQYCAPYSTPWVTWRGFIISTNIRQTLKHSPTTWRVPYDHVVYKDPKQVLVSYSLQFLLVLLLYPIPEEGRGAPPKNFIRHFLGRLHRPQDFQFLVDGMMRTLNQPVIATLRASITSNTDYDLATSYIVLFTWQSKVGRVGSRNDHAILGNATM